MSIISLKNVNKYYKTGDSSFHALKDINLDIEEGKFIVILGKSGSGKSTLLNIIGGLDGYDSGEVIMEGFNYKDADDSVMSDFRCRHIGFVFQSYNLIPVLNVYENITFPVNISGTNIDSKYIASIIKKLGLEGKEKSFPNQLSGGQQQRVAIARALANKPRIILADEPTGNLDTVIGNDVLNLLTSGVKEYGHTLVMITHNPDIAKYADVIVNMEDGKIISIQ
ncbi:MAG: ABC transporter ATP-binding protein [Oscillospiraceae bacterium]|nr:ABC transporter ATP-binding protein [Oscillospiraceae bacterium]